jgi:hypothetical protein
MKKGFLLALLFLCLHANASDETIREKFGIEVFPQVIPFKIYSAQLVYGITTNDFLIVGFTYLNNFYPDKKAPVGQFNAPTIPIGYRRYLWKNLNLEGQLWPAYNFYKDLTTNEFYNGFDLAGSLRFGYKIDFNLKRLAIYSNIQIEYLFGIYKGNKPDNFDTAKSGIPVFPAISIGYKW